MITSPDNSSAYDQTMNLDLHQRLDDVLQSQQPDVVQELREDLDSQPPSKQIVEDLRNDLEKTALFVGEKIGEIKIGGEDYFFVIDPENGNLKYSKEGGTPVSLVDVEAAKRGQTGKSKEKIKFFIKTAAEGNRAEEKRIYNELLKIIDLVLARIKTKEPSF